MASARDVLQGLRERGYGGSGDAAAPEATPALERALPLTPEELKSVGATEDGKEICLSVYGVLAGDQLQVTRVESESPMTADGEPTPEDVMRGMPNRAMPTPS